MKKLPTIFQRAAQHPKKAIAVALCVIAFSLWRLL